MWILIFHDAHSKPNPLKFCGHCVFSLNCTVAWSTSGETQTENIRSNITRKSELESWHNFIMWFIISECADRSENETQSLKRTWTISSHDLTDEKTRFRETLVPRPKSAKTEKQHVSHEFQASVFSTETPVWHYSHQPPYTCLLNNSQRQITTKPCFLTQRIPNCW